MRRRRLRSVGDLLVAALDAGGESLRDDDLAELPQQVWSALVPAARHHGVVPALHLALRSSTVAPDDVREALHRDYGTSTQFHLRAWAVLMELRALLDHADIAYAALKGPVVAEALYPRPDLRSYRDLDLLVAPSRFEDALRLVESTGAVVIEQNWELVIHLLKGELNLLHPTYVAVDLHWSLLYDETLRRQFAWRDEPFLERSVERVMAGHTVRCLDPVDELIHLCLHACLAGCHRLSWMQDIRLAGERPGLDWGEVERRARAARVTVPVAAALERTARTLGIAGPAREHRRDEGRAWLEMIRLLDRVRPPGRMSRRLSGHLLVAGTRATSRDSAAAATHAIAEAAKDLVTNADHPWRTSTPALTTNPMLEPRLGPAGREAYLRAVGRQHLG